MKLKSIKNVMIMFMVVSLMIALPLKAKADAFTSVTLGGDLTEEQKQSMLKYFGVTKDQVNLVQVNIDDEKKYLGKVATKEQIGTKSISCSYVEPTESGGINVTTYNLYWVTSDMIKNSLITAGITNAKVKAAAPFNVSGTAALTGIMEGFEASKGGNQISEANKEAANQELVTTGNLGQKIGKDKAAGLMNEVKKEVVEQKPESKDATEKIVKNVVNNYNYNLNDNDVKNITNVMYKISNLNLDYSKIKGQLNQVTDKLKSTLESDETKGFFAKTWTSIKNFFGGLFK
ncbi:DUF1002 domain-containing protein [Clostridium felsineum]|uniref:Uncharacterized protein n=1 Tax=Clostridium felsineum TaxID=36839 RepID=A0A1S8KYQ6_9CLOT|nr:DUF1002 domain-containing protein [Clostridium felsineum]URZ07820.1 putative protein YpuA [Clostridium felsineum]URZ12851.1 putative protein YpuA [Clostridium felsineum]